VSKASDQKRIHLHSDHPQLTSDHSDQPPAVPAALGQLPLLFVFWRARFPVHSNFNVRIKHYPVENVLGKCCQLQKADIRPHFEAAAAKGAKKQVFASLLIYSRRECTPASSKIKETNSQMLPPVSSCRRAWSHPVTPYQLQGSPLNLPTGDTELFSRALVGHPHGKALGRLHCRHDTFPTMPCFAESPIKCV